MILKHLYILILFYTVTSLPYVKGFSCVQCSSRFDEKCATDPHALDGEECSNEHEESCVVYLSDDGHTERGCRSEWETEMNLLAAKPTNFELCDYESCNRNIFPLNRIKCYECPSGKCLRPTSLKLKLCPLVNDECVVPNTDKGIIPRCLSSAKAGKQCREPGECETCSETGCNFMRTEMKGNSATFLNNHPLLTMVPGLIVTFGFTNINFII